jgi:hypothetical protein
MQAAQLTAQLICASRCLRSHLIAPQSRRRANTLREALKKRTQTRKSKDKALKARGRSVLYLSCDFKVQPLRFPALLNTAWTVN